MMPLGLAVAAIVALVWGAHFLGRGGWARITAGLYYLSPAITIGFPVSVLWSLVTAPYVLWRDRRRFAMPVVWLSLVFALVNAFAYLWSPAPVTALTYGLGPMLAVPFVLAGFVGSVQRFPQLVPSTLAVISPIVLVQAASTVLFRLRPDLEATYYGSGAALALLGPKTRQLTEGLIVNNVVYPEKAGGILFLNGNRASMVLGVTALVYAMYALARRSDLAWIVAAAAAAGCVGSGSKTGIALFVAVPLLAIFWAAFTGARPAGRILAGVVVLGVGAAGAWTTLTLADDYVYRSQVALIPRRRLWSTAIEAWQTHPWRGLGFGGWEEFANARLPSVQFQQVTSVVFPIDYPPHNSILFSLTRVGIVGGVLVVLVTLAGIRACLHRIEAQRTFTMRLAMTCGAGTWVWVFVHGMGDNTEVFGTFQSLPMLALALGFCVSLGSSAGELEDGVPRAAAQDRAMTRTSSGE